MLWLGESSSSVAPKRRTSCLFPLNQSIFTLPGKLLKCCCSLGVGACSSCLAGILPQRLPHWQLWCVHQRHVGVPEDKAGGASQGLPGHVCTPSSESGVCSSPAAPRKAGVGEGEATGSFIQPQGEILLPQKSRREGNKDGVQQVF